METRLMLSILAIIFILVVGVWLFVFMRRPHISYDHSDPQEKFLVTTEKNGIPVAEEGEKTDYVNGKVVVESIIKVDFDEKTQKILINGNPNPEINLKGGGFYEFHNVSNHPLYFSKTEKSLESMKNSIDLYKGNPKGLQEGSIFINADKNAPSKFYYNSSLIKGAGNKINIIHLD